MNGNNTRITYSYRDAQDQLVSSSLVLAGQMTQQEGEIIGRKLHDHQYFIPSQVGLDALQERLGRAANDDDVIWHRWEWSGVSLTDEPPSVGMTSRDLAERFDNAVWDMLTASAELYHQPVRRASMRM